MSSESSIIKTNNAASKERLIDQLRDMPIVEVACRRAGIGRATYYRWLKKDPEFAAQCREALEQSTAAVSDIAEAKLINEIQAGNMTAISFWLRSRHSAYQARVNVQGTINHRSEVLTTEQSKIVQYKRVTSQLIRDHGIVATERQHFKNYASYILQQGSLAEKDGFVRGLNTILTVSNKKYVDSTTNTTV